MAPLDLSPHPLVPELTTELGEAGIPSLTGALKKGATTQQKALVFAESSDVPELVTFVGYLGATIRRERRDWCVFYFDWQLDNWLLVEQSGIVRRQTIQDLAAPSETRDVIWVKADAAVGATRGSHSVEAQFLTGEFIRAGDFDVPVSGGTFAPSTGVFCQAKSAGCCTRRTR
jgi:hypothetical protein